MNLREVLKHVLGTLTKLVLAKHKPDIIVITGKGQTSIVREFLYFSLYEKEPTRRNLEFPESEFSIPLTVFGEFTYPTQRVKWISIILKVLVLLFKLKPYKHTLIIELSSLNKNVYNYWLNILKPKFIINVSEKEDLTNKALLNELVKKLIKEVTEYYKINDEYLNSQFTKIKLPTSRIKFLRGVNNSTIIDNLHYYYPTPLISVLEVAKAFDGNKVLFTTINTDEQIIKEEKEKWVINPHNYTPKPEDIILIRGPKTQVSLKKLGIK